MVVCSLVVTHIAGNCTTGSMRNFHVHVAGRHSETFEIDRDENL